jgi:hypothetical protein
VKCGYVTVRKGQTFGFTWATFQKAVTCDKPVVARVLGRDGVETPVCREHLRVAVR